MADAHLLITEHINIWTSAIKKRSATGRGSNKKLELTGIKKLRELILELAVRGQLVPQDPNDEPASVLLEKIAAEKAQLIKDKKIKKPKALPEIGEDEKRFNLPGGWEWCQLGTIIDRISNGFSGKQNKDGYGYPLTRIETISSSTINLSKIGFSPSIPENKLNYYRLHIGDILLSHINSDYHVAKTALVEDDSEIYHGVNLLLIRLNKYLSPSFINLVINQLRLSGYFLNIAQHAIGQSSINQSKIIEVVSCLPPLAEQHRIVTKVDELMALCDQLEQQTEDSITTHQTLVEALLATLTSSENTEAFNQNWARIAAHFDILFTTEHSIDQLKQTVLQLAVMGKLVPQDPTDEPASVLLEKIAAEKAQLIKDKKIKKQKPLPGISDDKKPFELPSGWTWSRLEYVALNSEAGWSPRCLPTAREDGRWGVLKVSAVTWGQFNPNENKELPNSLEPRVQYEIKDGDFLISRANTAELVARAVIVPNDAPKKLMMSDKIIRFVLSSNIEGGFISLVNNSRISRDYYAEVAGGTSSSMKNVSREQIRSLVVALPPLREQQHIVAKVNELMTLCDQLKAHLSDAQATQLCLANATVEEGRMTAPTFGKGKILTSGQNDLVDQFAG